MRSFVWTFFGLCGAKIYFRDDFSTHPFVSKRWVQSAWKQDSGEAGTLEYSGGLWGAGDRGGIRTTEDAKFYAFSAKIWETFDNAYTDSLAFGFSVKHEQRMDCGGGYAKLLPPGIDQSQFNGYTDLTIMFGPDICGYSTKKVQVIFNWNGEILFRNEDIKCPDDEYTHTYLLIINKDETYEVRIDGKRAAKSKMKLDWSFEKPKTIKDPTQLKPEYWVDDEEIDDPDDKKQDDWDDEPTSIPDPDATKPDVWDDEEDGEWLPPMIDNPDYRGEWIPKQIPNPDYNGPWIHPKILNPDYVEAKDVYKRGPIGYIGVEVWQVKSGTVFNDFILTDSVDEATKFLEERKTNIEYEKAAKKAFDGKATEEDPYIHTLENVDDQCLVAINSEEFNFCEWIKEYDLRDIQQCFIDYDMKTLKTLNMDNIKFGKLMSDDRIIGNAHLIPNIVKGIQSLNKLRAKENKIIFTTPTEHSVFTQINEYIQEIYSVKKDIENKKVENNNKIEDFYKTYSKTLDEMQQEVDKTFDKLRQILNEQQQSLTNTIKMYRTELSEKRDIYKQETQNTHDKLSEPLRMIEEDIVYYEELVDEFKSILNKYSDDNDDLNENKQKREKEIIGLGESASDHYQNRQEVLKQIKNNRFIHIPTLIYSVIINDENYNHLVDSMNRLVSISQNKPQKAKFVPNH